MSAKSSLQGDSGPRWAGLPRRFLASWQPTAVETGTGSSPPNGRPRFDIGDHEKPNWKATPDCADTWKTAFERRWSPQQISAELRREYPDDEEMRVSHETIYQSLFVQTQGSLRKELTRYLRTGRTRGRSHSRFKHHFTLETSMAVYFCDPHSPWQRVSNENTNGLLRRVLPKVHGAPGLFAGASRSGRA